MALDLWMLGLLALLGVLSFAYVRALEELR